MQIFVRHKFQPLSLEQSGKQHRFSWHGWDAGSKQSHFLCHAMYQSGQDNVTTSNGDTAKRGEVFRLQFDEKGSCEPGKGLELKVDGDNWQAHDYERVADYILHRCKTNGDAGEVLSSEQKAAVLCQLASLYNLMATQYGLVFLRGTRDFDAEPNVREMKSALDEMITEKKLRVVSQWFKGLASDLLAGREPDASGLVLPAPVPHEGIPHLMWHHGIQAQRGTKGHLFAFFKIKDEIPNPVSFEPLHPDAPHHKIAEAGYMSGELGEKLAVFPMDPKNPLKADMSLGLPLRARLGAEVVDEPLAPDVLQSPLDPVPVVQNAQIIHQRMQEGKLNADQAMAALVMLASLYRLVATHYNGEFGYDPKGQPLQPHYFDDPAGDKAAEEAKVEAFRRGQSRDKTFDVMIEGNGMFTRPMLISGKQSLDNFVADAKFEKEAEQALEVAARLALGQGLEQSVKPAALNAWSLGKWIDDDSRVVNERR